MTIALTAVGTVLATLIDPGATAQVAPDTFDCSVDPEDLEPNDRDINRQWCGIEKFSVVLTNPAYYAAKAANATHEDPRLIFGDATWALRRPVDLVFSDPFRAPYRWQGAGRGDYLHVRFTDNSDFILNARTTELFSPLDAAAQGPLPGILLLCHAGCAVFGDFWTWMWAAQPFAEHGYIVMFADIQGNDIDNARAATDWFVSTPEEPTARGEWNPWYERLDRTRLGVVGHSGAAGIALTLGNTDPRFSAVVTWDGGSPADIDPSVPTMAQVADSGTALSATFDAFSADGVDTMQVVPRASSHTDWSALHGALYTEQVATYYTLAWFDRHLRPEAAADALDRLTASGTDAFDDSSDVHSIGTGFFDPVKVVQGQSVERGNVPLTIEGMTIRSRLSWSRPSAYFLDGGALQCANLRDGCP
ncbi:MAG: alpha/beta hydrolase family protein [Candidatus Binatia bacterium]